MNMKNFIKPWLAGLTSLVARISLHYLAKITVFFFIKLKETHTLGNSLFDFFRYLWNQLPFCIF